MAQVRRGGGIMFDPISYAKTIKNKILIDENAAQLGDLVNFVQRDSRIFGLRYYPGTDTYQRLYGAIGLEPAIGIDDEIVFNPFDYVGPWRNMVRTVDLLGNVTVKIPTIYHRYDIGSDSNGPYIDILLSECEFSGSYVSPCQWDHDNNVALDYVLYGAYNGYVSGGKLQSVSGVAPDINHNIIEMRTYAEANGVGYQQLDIHAHRLLTNLITVEFGTNNHQDVVQGYVAGQWTDSHTATVAETGVNRIILANANADEYRVGQTISIGTSQGGNQIFYGRQITSIDGYDASNKAISFDGAPVDIAVGNMLYNTAAVTGFSDSFGSSIGVMTANDGKYPWAYRGIENPYGNQLQFVDGVNINDNQAWVCDDARDYASNLFAAPYKQLTYLNANTNGYVQEMGYDPDNPTALFPTTVGGGSGDNYGDYYYQSSGQRIARVGAYWSYGSYAGSSCWFLTYSSSDTDVYVGGRLVKKAS